MTKNEILAEGREKAVGGGRGRGARVPVEKMVEQDLGCLLLANRSQVPGQLEGYRRGVSGGDVRRELVGRLPPEYHARAGQEKWDTENGNPPRDPAHIVLHRPQRIEGHRNGVSG
jgi:hypothetical protein